MTAFSEMFDQSIVVEGITFTYRADAQERRIDVQSAEIDSKRLRAMYPRLMQEIGRPGWQMVAHHARGRSETLN